MAGNNDISAMGTVAVITAHITAPHGIVLTSFSDDTSGISSESVQIADAVITLGGKINTFKKPTLIPKVISVMPNSDEDKALSQLLQANTATSGKRIINDVITLTITQPDGRQEVYNNGMIYEGMKGNDYGNDGRLKTKTYGFRFESMTQNDT